MFSFRVIIFVVQNDKVFSDMDFLGWYSTGDHPTAKDISVHRQIAEINESPLFLQMSPGMENIIF